MPDLMYSCEQQKPFISLDAKKQPVGRELRWVEVKATEVRKGDHIRCAYCHGAVRLHKQQKVDGIKDHVEHRMREDSIRCKGGFYFVGPEHQMSFNPVV